MDDPRSIDAEAEAKRLEKFNDEASDWYAFCPICKTQIIGTRTQLQQHAMSHGTKS